MPGTISQPIAEQRPELRRKPPLSAWLGVWVLLAWYFALSLWGALDLSPEKPPPASFEDWWAWRAAPDPTDWVLLFVGLPWLLSGLAMIVVAIRQRRASTRSRMAARAMRANARVTRVQQREPRP